MDNSPPKSSHVLIPDGESIIYNGRFHFFSGGQWLALSLLCLGVSAVFAFGTLLTPPPGTSGNVMIETSSLLKALSFTAALFSFGFFLWYLLPFWRTFILITNQRALISVGHFTCVQEQVLPYQLEDWEIRQNFLESLFGYGHITLRLIEGRQLRIIFLPFVTEPHTFMRHMEELCPADARHSAQRAMAAAATDISTNEENPPQTLPQQQSPTPPPKRPS